VIPVSEMCYDVGCTDRTFVCHKCREYKADVVERFVVPQLSAPTIVDPAYYTPLPPEAVTLGYRTHLCDACSQEMWHSTRKMFSGEMLAYVGTDAQRWAQAFVERFAVTGRYETTNDNDPIGLMIGWFANAIEAGRAAGREQ
jgi:hypothetical protein